MERHGKVRVNASWLPAHVKPGEGALIFLQNFSTVSTSIKPCVDALHTSRIATLTFDILGSGLMLTQHRVPSVRCSLPHGDVFISAPV